MELFSDFILMYLNVEVLHLNLTSCKRKQNFQMWLKILQDK